MGEPVVVGGVLEQRDLGQRVDGLPHRGPAEVVLELGGRAGAVERLQQLDRRGVGLLDHEVRAGSRPEDVDVTGGRAHRVGGALESRPLQPAAPSGGRPARSGTEPGGVASRDLHDGDDRQHRLLRLPDDH
jgi:hypothetical protein